MNGAFSLAVARRRQTWSRILEAPRRRCSSKATNDLLPSRRTRTELSKSRASRSSNRFTMSSTNYNETPVAADGGGQEGKSEQTSSIAVESNGVATGGDKSQQQGAESDTHGFSRPEMHSEALVGSVGLYERHVFLSWKGPETWPSRVEAAAESDGAPNVPHLLANALKARKNDMPKKTRLTVCAAAGQDGSSDGDVFIFPDRVGYKGLTHIDVESFVENALVNGKEWEGSQLVSLSGSYIFVCCHGSRDLRCGTCGMQLVEKLKEEIKVRGLEGQIFVLPCSHIGGHKYAGNVIVYSSTGTGPVSGHWYGYVSPGDVPLILDQHIGKGEIIDRLWRGQMGLNEGDQMLAQQDRLSKLANGKSPAVESADQENGAKGCGAAGCCQLAEPPAKEKQIPNFLQSIGSSVHDGHLIFLDDDDSTDDEPIDPRIPLWGSYYIPLPKWVGTWEREDTNAALAVVGAVAAVAFAIQTYRHS